MCLFHKWQKWEQYTITKYGTFFSVPTVSTQLLQKRVCDKCGKMEVEFISNNDCVFREPYDKKLDSSQGKEFV